MISLIENLTGKRWNFGAVAGLTALGVEGFATFNDFGLGLFTIINDGADDVEVVLWGRTYTVASNSRWDFMAHPQVGSTSTDLARTGDERFRGSPIKGGAAS